MDIFSNSTVTVIYISAVDYFKCVEDITLSEAPVNISQLFHVPMILSGDWHFIRDLSTSLNLKRWTKVILLNRSKLEANLRKPGSHLCWISSVGSEQRSTHLQVHGWKQMEAHAWPSDQRKS